jgi:uncharacterized OB-fold protein
MDEDAQFWAALGEGRFTVQHCTRCDVRLFPPGPTCWHCGGAELTWDTLDDDARGTVYSWTQCHKSYMHFAELVPYTIVIGELADGSGIRVVGRLLEEPSAPVAIGDALRLRCAVDALGQPSYGWALEAGR